MLAYEFRVCTDSGLYFSSWFATGKLTTLLQLHVKIQILGGLVAGWNTMVLSYNTSVHRCTNKPVFTTTTVTWPVVTITNTNNHYHSSLSWVESRVDQYISDISGKRMQPKLQLLSLLQLYPIQLLFPEFPVWRRRYQFRLLNLHGNVKRRGQRWCWEVEKEGGGVRETDEEGAMVKRTN